MRTPKIEKRVVGEIRKTENTYTMFNGGWGLTGALLMFKTGPDLRARELYVGLRWDSFVFS